MFSFRFYTFILLAVILQRKMGVETARKIIVPQVYREDANERMLFDTLVAFARLGDPCSRLPAQPNPEERNHANAECFRVVTGYERLPPEIRTRCPNDINSVSCQNDLTGTAGWFCGATVGLITNSVFGSAIYDRKSVRFSYCIENLDFGYSDPWLKQPGQMDTTKRTQKAVSVPVAWNQENHFVRILKRFLEVGDPCADLDPIPTSDAIFAADAQCMTAIDGYTRLPTGEACRCKNIRKPGCKKEPYPSEKWCCGAVMQLGKSGFFPCAFLQKSGLVCLSYCTEGLTVQTPFIPRGAGAVNV